MSGAVTRIIPPVTLHFQEGERCGPGNETQPDEGFHGRQDLGWAKWDDVPKSQCRVNHRRIVEEGIELMAPHAMQFTETDSNQGPKGHCEDHNLDDMQDEEPENQVQDANTRVPAGHVEHPGIDSQRLVMEQYRR